MYLEVNYLPHVQQTVHYTVDVIHYYFFKEVTMYWNELWHYGTLPLSLRRGET